MLNLFQSFRKRRQSESEADQVKFEILSESASLPVKHFPTDAGYDLFSPTEFLIIKGKSLVIDIKVKVTFPLGYCGVVHGRSGLAAQNWLLIHSGVIDFGYTGSIKVIIFNLGQQNYCIHKGDRIAQLVITKIYQTEVFESQPKRLTQGLGSSGK